MEFKRYDGFINSSPQKLFDKELPICPFCGGYPNWKLNIKKSFTIDVTCVCEKCQGKLYAECNGTRLDDLRVVDLGEKNIHNLSLNGNYHVIALNSLSKNSKNILKEDDYFVDTQSDNIVSNNEQQKSNTQKMKGLIIGVISFVIVFVLLLWLLLPDGTDQSTTNVTGQSSNYGIGISSTGGLEPVKQSSMNVEESFGMYYVTITGSAKNTSKRNMDYVSITFTLYDSAGNVVGTALANQAGLGAGETWIYSAVGISTTNRPVSYKSTDVTAI